MPVNYNLTLWPQLASNNFTGLVKIHVKVVKPTKDIYIHAAPSLRINSFILKDGLKTIEKSTNIAPNESEVLSINVKHQLTQGKYTITLDFSGALNGLVGFYASKLKNGR